MIHICDTATAIEREELLAPFGFKGGYLTEIWQILAWLESDHGCQGLGLGAQSVLWSDARVFSMHHEDAGNEYMYRMTTYALSLAKGATFQTPQDLLDSLLPKVHAYGKAITGLTDLRLTFSLNALVAVDNAAWQLYHCARNASQFNDLVPPTLRSALTYKHRQLACIPLVSYNVPREGILQLVDEGAGVLKIKIGADPEKNGDPEAMLAWDMRRLTEIHQLVHDRETPLTSSGHIAYYLDANSRYDSKERLLRLLDHAERLGMLERIILLEEPFSEESEDDVHDIPVCITADESAHSDTEALKRIEMGYRAIALKPIAKTMSMSLRVAQLAHEHGIACFCADLTVNPILVDWNKMLASRLAPIPGMRVGMLETNGRQNYRHWARMESYHPYAGAEWTKPIAGAFNLTDDFYANDGGIFQMSAHYRQLLEECRTD